MGKWDHYMSPPYYESSSIKTKAVYGTHHAPHDDYISQ